MKQILVLSLFLSVASYGKPVDSDLRNACRKGKFVLVKRHLSRGANLYRANKNGETCLHLAAKNNHGEVIKYLSERYGSSLEVNRRDDNDRTPLHLAAKDGHEASVDQLLKAGANAELVDKAHLKPRDVAALFGHPLVLKKLISKPQVNVKNKVGLSLLHFAVRGKSLECIEIVLQNDADPNIKNYGKWTPLHLAAKNDFADGIKLLFKNGAKLNTIDFGGWTPLHVAAHFGSEKAAQTLIELGANTTLRNFQKETAKDIAIKRQHGKLVLLFNSIRDNKKNEN